MNRRSLLAASATGLAGALAGCSAVTKARVALTDPRWTLRATRTTADASEYHCSLGDGFVAAHSQLETVLDRATDTPRREWTKPVYLQKDDGVRLGTDLSEYCQKGFRGVYAYDGDYYFVSLSDRHPERGDPDAHEHGNETGNHTSGNDTASGNHTGGNDTTSGNHTGGNATGQ